MKKLYVFTKDGSDITNQFTPDLQTGETVTSISIGAVTPADSGAPTMTISSGTTLPVTFTIVGGNTGVTYGFPLTFVTSLRRFVITVATNVLSDSFDPYPNADPNSYQDLVGEIMAGKSALAIAAIPFPPTFDPSGGYVLWDILDELGTVYASGNAFDFRILATGVTNTVIARSLINVPSSIPASPGKPYQLRYTLTVGEQKIYQFEAITVAGLSDVPLGTFDSIEMQGDPATVSLVTKDLFQNYVVELWAGGTLLASTPIANAERVSSGYFACATIDTTAMLPSCIPYSVIWKMWNQPAQTFREKAALWIVTDSMMQAIDDVQSKVNKARTTLYGTPDSQFPSTEIMKWLRRGMDLFNGFQGQFTSFTMTNAMGVVREYWLLCAEKYALESQYLLEGEKAFNYSGANISLDVDRTQYLDNMASKIQSILDNELKPLKQNLIIKGQTSGDGSGASGTGDFSQLQHGAMGAVGITITPASIYNGAWGGYRGGFGF
jgi:hypothetical protein